jgi:hypothetical protein
MGSASVNPQSQIPDPKLRDPVSALRNRPNPTPEDPTGAYRLMVDGLIVDGLNGTEAPRQRVTSILSGIRFPISEIPLICANEVSRCKTAAYGVADWRSPLD